MRSRLYCTHGNLLRDNFLPSRSCRLYCCCAWCVQGVSGSPSGGDGAAVFTAERDQEEFQAGKEKEEVTDMTYYLLYSDCKWGWHIFSVLGLSLWVGKGNFLNVFKMALLFWKPLSFSAFTGNPGIGEVHTAVRISHQQGKFCFHLNVFAVPETETTKSPPAHRVFIMWTISWKLSGFVCRWRSCTKLTASSGGCVREHSTWREPSQCCHPPEPPGRACWS